MGYDSILAYDTAESRDRFKLGSIEIPGRRIITSFALEGHRLDCLDCLQEDPIQIECVLIQYA